MTYNVFSGTLNPSQSINQSSILLLEGFLEKLRTDFHEIL